ncbi:MAG: AAA family ATPase [Candidatus Woesearchaeota archaeon]|nr:AAA family ATPase [Candidatus Woesearchaeota archaeon]
MKCKTGIKGFDELVEGGLVEGSSVLFTGNPGTGKTIFALEFLYNGATKFNEKGLYVSFEERAEEIKAQAKQFGWDFGKLERAKKIQILAIPVSDITAETAGEIIKLCRKDGIKRLVIDSISTLAINAPIYATHQELTVKDVLKEDVFFSPPIIGEMIVKRFIYTFIDNLKDLQSTTKLLVSEATESGAFPENALAEFLTDGLIHITFEGLGGSYSRSLIVRKMRQTRNDEDIHPVEIAKSGIIIHSLEEK